MTMEWCPVGLHEFQKLVRTRRFWLLSAVTIGLFPVSSLNFADYYRVQKAEENRVEVESRDTLQGLQYPSRLKQAELEVSKKIDATWLVTFGTERLVPPLARFNLIDAVVKPGHPLTLNLLHSYTRYIDWVFIFAYCLSLFALLLGHDAISEESEMGTLRLVLVNPISRASFLLGKLLGILAAIAAPFLVGASLSLLVVDALDVPVHQQDLIVFGVVVVQSLLFLASLALAAVWISVAARSSTMALVWVVILWFYLIVLMPGLSRATAAAIVTLEDEPEKQIAMILENSRTPPSQEESEERSREQREAEKTARRDYDRTVLTQLHVAQSISWISPLALYTEAVQRMTRTGIARHEEFVREVKRYMEELWERSQQSENKPGPRSTLDEETFVGTEISLGERLRDSFGATGIMLAFSSVAFFLLFVMFGRMAIR